MLERITLARPYARAAFQAARDDQALAEWSERLALATAIVETPEMRALTGDPRIDDERMMALFDEVGGKRFDEHFRNFLLTLAANDRLELLPEISVHYEHYRREADQRLQVRVDSARELDDEAAAKLTERLKSRFGREIDLEVHVDESLVGGAVIRAGDQVIDGSVRGRLERLGRRVAG